MGLKSLQLKTAYDSDEDDVLNDFYIPVLANSKMYMRLAGFFSSSALAVAAKGILGLIKNGGRMKLVVGAKLRKADIEAIRKGLQTRTQAIEKVMIEDLDSIESDFVRDHVKALGWMVANKTLDMKVAIPFSFDALEKESGIYHQKVGIFQDAENDANHISFSGSINESKTGWIGSIEEFKVFRSWSQGEKAYVENDLNKFSKYWSGKAKRALVVDIPNAVQNKLVELAPNTIEEIGLEKHYKRLKIRPWRNQVEAIQAWTNNGCVGLLSMATGSGKTYAALLASSLAPTSVITIILVPTIPILNQWGKKEIPSYDNSAEVIMCSGNNPEWKTILPLELAKLRRTGGSYQRTNRLYVIAVLKTASTEAFLKQWDGIPASKVQIVCDEVHHIGAPTFQSCLRLPSERRLGLSATPERDWDPVGTEKITEYFGPTIFEYGIQNGINDGHLSHYKYYPFFAFLTPHEYDEYSELTEKINRELARLKQVNKKKSAKTQRDDNSHQSKTLQTLLLRRARIKKKAEDKPRVFKEIINKTSCKPLLVFCEDTEQVHNIRNVLQQQAISYGIYTSKMTDSQRKKILSTFRQELLDVLLAIRCLDEGLDVPKCQGCIIISSCTSTRQFIQRRGRILRRSTSKEIAELNDIIVLPPKKGWFGNRNVAKNLILQELKRVYQLAEAAENYWEVRNIMRKQLADFGLETFADI